MDSTILSAIISACVTTIGLVSAYAGWRRDVKLKLRQMREQVSTELIRERMVPYSEFMKHLEVFSSLHKQEFETNIKWTHEAMSILQGAIYGKIGLLAAHETRQLLLFVRLGLLQFSMTEISFEELLHRVWALHFALRSDIGIIQPMWDSEVERIQSRSTEEPDRSWDYWEQVVKHYPWQKLDFRYTSDSTNISNRMLKSPFDSHFA